MRALLIFFAVLSLARGAIGAADEPTRYHADWKSERWSQRPFPEIWRQADTPTTVRALAAYQNYRPTMISVGEVVSRFGTPDRCLVHSSPDIIGAQWLIYDLADGYAVGFFIPARQSHHAAVGVVLDPKGRLLRTIVN